MKKEKKKRSHLENKRRGKTKGICAGITIENAKSLNQSSAVVFLFREARGQLYS